MPSGPTRKIDAHQHFWRVAAQDQPWRNDHHGALARDFLPNELVRDAHSVGVNETVLVQSVDEKEENDRLALFGQHPIVAGVVGWAPLSEPRKAREELERMPMDKLSGVRCLIGRDSLGWLQDNEVVALFRHLADRGLAWDVVPITSEQISSVLRLAAKVPELKIVVDHLGRPPVERGGWDPWARHIKELGGRPNVACKLSVGLDVLTAWPQWHANELRRYLGWVCEQFGSDRVMLASNWPVVTLRVTYAQAWNDLESLVGELVSGPDLDRVTSETAAQWYGLPGPPVPGPRASVGTADPKGRDQSTLAP